MTRKVFFELVEMKAKIASVWPFLLGLFFAGQTLHHLNWGLSLLFFIAMFLFNMAVDINDNYQDYTKATAKAADWKQHTNVIGVHHLPIRQIFWLMAGLAIVAAAIGVGLVIITGLPLLWMGLFCFAVGFFYAGGPKPLSTTPTGEFFAGFTMGFMIMLITVYLNSYNVVPLTWSLAGHVLLASGIAVFAIANILLANNISDEAEDLALNRKTLVYYIGRSRALGLFVTMYVLGYLCLVISVFWGDLPGLTLLTLLSIPLVWRNTRGFLAKQVKKETFILAVRNSGILAVFTIGSAALGVLLTHLFAG